MTFTSSMVNWIPQLGKSLKLLLPSILTQRDSTFSCWDISVAGPRVYPNHRLHFFMKTFVFVKKISFLKHICWRFILKSLEKYIFLVLVAGSESKLEKCSIRISGKLSWHCWKFRQLIFILKGTRQQHEF